MASLLASLEVLFGCQYACAQLANLAVSEDASNAGGLIVASSPGPAQKLGKGPGHTSCMCCVSILCLE